MGDAPRFAALLTQLYGKDWVVYAKPPFAGPDRVLKYLARYTHRIAIANQRLLSITDGNITFSWHNYAKNKRNSTMTLTSAEFLRRFLLHVLPRGFVRIRHYGFLANRSHKLDQCRKLLGVGHHDDLIPSEHAANTQDHGEEVPEDHTHCPVCQIGVMVRVRDLSPCRATRLGRSPP